MTDETERRAWTIRILNWRDYQNYKDRDPPWIKLHQRRLLDKPEWRRLDGSAAKLLVDLWMLAAGAENAGTLNMRLSDLAYRLRGDEAETLTNLHILEVAEFVELSPSLQASASDRKQAQKFVSPETETETEGEQRQRQKLASPAEREQKRHPWLPPFAAAWKARFQGTTPWGQIGAALLPLRAEYPDAEILSRWQRYLAKTDGQYASPQNFAKRFGEWADKAPRDNYLKPRDVA